MKLHALLLLAGFALVAAGPMIQKTNDVNGPSAFEADSSKNFLKAEKSHSSKSWSSSNFVMQESSSSKTKIEKQHLLDEWTKLLQKCKDDIQAGKKVNQELITQIHDLCMKMQKQHFDCKEKTDEIFQNLSDEQKQQWSSIYNKATQKTSQESHSSRSWSSSNFAMHESSSSERKVEVQHLLDEWTQLLQKCKKSIQSGNAVNQELIMQMKDLCMKLKKHASCNTKINEIFDGLSEEQKQQWSSIYDDVMKETSQSQGSSSSSWGGDSGELQQSSSSSSNVEVEQLIQRWTQVLQKCKTSIETGSEVSQDLISQMKDLCTKLEEQHVSCNTKTNEIFGSLTEEQRQQWSLIYNKVTQHASQHKDSSSSTWGDDSGEWQQSSSSSSNVEVEQLIQRWSQVLQKCKTSIETGNEVSQDLISQMKDLCTKLEERHVNCNTKTNEIFGSLTEEQKQQWSLIYSKVTKQTSQYESSGWSDSSNELQQSSSSSSNVEVQQLIQRWTQVLQKCKKSIETGNEVSQDLIMQVKDLCMKLKKQSVSCNTKTKEIFGGLTEEQMQQWILIYNNIMKETSQSESSSSSSWSGGNSAWQQSSSSSSKYEVQQLMQRWTQVLQKCKKQIETGKEINQDLIMQMKDLCIKLEKHGVSCNKKTNEIFGDLTEAQRQQWSSIYKKVMMQTSQSQSSSSSSSSWGSGSSSDWQQSSSSSSKVEVQKLTQRWTLLLQKCKKSIETGNEVNQDLIMQMKDLCRKMKKQHVSCNTKIDEIFETLTEEQRKRWLIIYNKVIKHSESVTEKKKRRQLLREWVKMLIIVKEKVQKGEELEGDFIAKMKDHCKMLRKYQINCKKKIITIVSSMPQDKKQSFDKTLSRIIRG